MKSFRIVRVDSSRGELHYILEESKTIDNETSEIILNLNEAEAKKITKNDASKLLFITREE